jgi:hypothetical protein
VIFRLDRIWGVPDVDVVVGVEMDASFTYGVVLRQTGSTTDQSQLRRRPS